ncbi:MAG: hypothetical protein FJ119_10820 [Deltaproteobacteria bacterium]|nr:hypothetical protein [Deltaproteobacteria bacterium]
MSDTALTPEVVEQETQALDIYQQAYAVKVVDKATYESAGALALAIKDMTKQVTDYWKPIKDKAYAAHKEICARETELLKPLKDAAGLIDTRRRAYLNEQELIRQEAERKARAIAEEQARKEREKLAAQAAKAAEKGKAEKASELAAQAAEVVAAPVFVAPAIDKNVRKDIAVSVTDLKALCAAIGAGIVPPTVVEVKAGALKSWAKAMQIKNGQVPGIVITETIAPVNRAA